MSYLPGLGPHGYIHTVLYFLHVKMIFSYLFNFLFKVEKNIQILCALLRCYPQNTIIIDLFCIHFIDLVIMAVRSIHLEILYIFVSEKIHMYRLRGL